MLSKDIGIDLGTANILIYVKKEGVVLDEPSVVAIEETTKKVIAVGKEANEMLGRTPGKIKAVRPMKDGVIADFELTEIMLEHFIKKIKAKTLITKPTILICCPVNITQVERNAIKEVAERTGAKKVYIEEEPKVAAIGAGMDISKPSANMVIDIGGGTTDIAILSLNDIVTSESIRLAGNTLDNDIIKYVKDKYKLLIGDTTAETIKKTLACVYNPNKKEKMEVRGRNITTGLPKTITINQEEVEEALHDSIFKILDTVKLVLEKTPPELSADIVEKGIVLTGGGAMIEGLVQLYSEKLEVPVFVADTPLTCVVEGTRIMLDNIHLLEK